MARWLEREGEETKRVDERGGGDNKFLRSS
jgi:hypothetical protein